MSMSVSVTTPMMVVEWWAHATKRRPLPSEESCVILSAMIDITRLAPPSGLNRQAAPTPIADAMDALRARIPLARERWGQDDSATAKLAIERVTNLERALCEMPVDWLLEPRVKIVDLGWHAHARFLYPFVEQSWLTAHAIAPKPHDESPLCIVLFDALKHLGEPVKSPKAVADLLAKPSASWRQDIEV